MEYFEFGEMGAIKNFILFIFNQKIFNIFEKIFTDIICLEYSNENQRMWTMSNLERWAPLKISYSSYSISEFSYFEFREMGATKFNIVHIQSVNIGYFEFGEIGAMKNVILCISISEYSPFFVEYLPI